MSEHGCTIDNIRPSVKAPLIELEIILTLLDNISSGSINDANYREEFVTARDYLRRLIKELS